MKNAIKSHGDAIFYLIGLKEEFRHDDNGEDRASEASINRAISILRFMHEGAVPIIDACTHNNGISLFFSINNKKFWEKIKPDGSATIYEKKEGNYVKRNTSEN